MTRALLVLVLFAAGCPSTETRAPMAAAEGTVLGNATCPVSGEPVAGTPGHPTFTSTFRGTTVGFMCPMHLREFEEGTEAQKDAWLAKARASVASDESRK